MFQKLHLCKCWGCSDGGGQNYPLSGSRSNGMLAVLVLMSGIWSKTLGPVKDLHEVICTTWQATHLYTTKGCKKPQCELQWGKTIKTIEISEHRKSSSKMTQPLFHTHFITTSSLLVVSHIFLNESNMLVDLKWWSFIGRMYFKCVKCFTPCILWIIQVHTSLKNVLFWGVIVFCTTQC